MFHMLEHQRRDRAALEAWLVATPIFGLSARQGVADASPVAWARALVGRLVDDGLLRPGPDGALALPAAQ
jgi:hypothetical protein